jgi:hypothetical protein
MKMTERLRRRPDPVASRRWLVGLSLAGMVAALGMPLLLGTTALTRGPYLQLLTTEGVTVVWKTDVAADCGLELWQDGEPAGTTMGARATECAVHLGGLLPGTEYTYVPLADGVALGPPAAFRTDDPALPYAFLVLGDSGTGDEEQLAVAARMGESAANLIVHTGDMVYPEALPEEWDPKFFTPYRDLLARLVLWPAIGNHDVRGDDGASWRDVFHTPANNAEGDERYYSFRYGNALFVVLDTYWDLDPGTPQYAFLREALGTTMAMWKFVVLHDTIYSSGDHGGDDTFRDDLVPVFDSLGVDLVFMGHDHDYERTVPLFADRPVPPGAGTVYVTTGGGGASLTPVGQSAFTAYSESVHHFVRVSVDAGVLMLEMVREDGTVGDTLSLIKEVPTSATLTPAGDTYVDGSEDAPTHAGASDELRVDGEPVRMAYLKFDLRTVPAPIVSAALTLFPINNSDDGGTAYPVPDSTWNEGDVVAPGLVWGDVDTNGDGLLTGADGAAFRPDLTSPLGSLGEVRDGEPRTIDVTAAFAGGQGHVRTVAVVSQGPDGVRYASREHFDLAKPPRLHLELSWSVCGNGLVEPGEECDDATCCTACRVETPGTPCADDGLFCTGIERCTAAGTCESVAAPCLDGPPCADTCDEARDTCDEPRGTPCEADGLFCTVDECDGAGRCELARPRCGPGAECAQGCDEEAESCFDPPGTPCADDGLYCTVDECDGLGTCTHHPGATCAMVIDRGSHGKGSECYVALSGVTLTRKRMIDCADGDPACDRDGLSDGACTFGVGVCALQTDMPGCVAAEAGAVTVTRISVKPRRVRLAIPPLPASVPACAPSSPIRVPLRRGGRKPGKLALRVLAVTTGRPRKDSDRIVLRCFPEP